MNRLPTLFLSVALAVLAGPGPGERVLLDAHNAYPYEGRWSDRVDRALATGLPLAIEQDLYWYKDPVSGQTRSVVAHGKPLTGDEPALREYFFEKIRPVVEREIARNQRERWPLIVLNLDFKTDEPEHHAAIWRLLGEYESWLTTAERTRDGAKPQPLDVRPVLVLTGAADSQEAAFHARVPVGARLRLFGAAAVRTRSDWRTAPEAMVARPASNYRRWWNNPWSVVEEGGQQKAAGWTETDRRRLDILVGRAHGLGYWIRFYTLNGYARVTERERQGTGAGYDFGSLDAVRLRWRAAVASGVDFIATDQYEDLAAELHASTADGKLEDWKLVETIALQGVLHHVQGIDVENGSLWVSSVDANSRKGFLSRFELPSGRLLKQVEVQDGARIHPGGIALDGDSVWVPVAEYDRDGPTAIQSRDKETLELRGGFAAGDHIGCIAAGEGFLVGGNWDSRTLYRWTKSGKLVSRDANPSPTAYQDLKIVGGELLGSGNLSRSRGAIEWLSLEGYRLRRRIEAGLTTRGVPYTNEGVAVRAGRLYLLPEDDPSRLFVFALR